MYPCWIFFKAHPAHQQRFLSIEGAEKFLDCFPTCDLVWFLFTLLEYKGPDRQSYSHFATETVESQKMELVSFLFKLQVLLSWNLSSDLGQPTSLQCPLEQVSSLIKPQLPTENWWKRIPHIPSSSDAVCSCRSDAGRPQSFPELRSGAKVLDTQADIGVPGVRASSLQLLSLLPRDSCQAGWVMQRYEGHLLRQMGAWGAHWQSHEAERAHCHLPDQHFLFYLKKSL